MKEKELADIVTDGMNVLTFDPVLFCEELQKKHRTLQDDFTAICLEWFRLNAGLAMDMFDGRNIRTKLVSDAVMETLKEKSL